jgi:hypothetical protein
LKAEKVYWLQSVAAVEVSLAPADRGGQLSHAENRLLMQHANREGNQDLRIAAIQQLWRKLDFILFLLRAIESGYQKIYYYPDYGDAIGSTPFFVVAYSMLLPYLESAFDL